MIARKKVLIVEDNNLNREMLRQILEPEYDCLEAENGQVALDVLKIYGERISLILMDIIMPVMDGYTLLSIIKANPTLSSIPVIVTTQNDDESDEVAALSKGAADFVAKPYKPQIILHRAASIINLRETAAMVNLIRYDRLTGLFGKEYFLQSVRNILTQRPGNEYVIICSDIENFKLLNDICGIAAGDRLLRNVADMYKKILGPDMICSRLNADRFACLVEQKDQDVVQEFVRASKRLNSQTMIRNFVMKWGVYRITDMSIPVEQMCDRALLAAHSIKGRYGKSYAEYDDELRSVLLHEQAITESMEPALVNGEFEVYLQPKFRVRDGRLSGAEALIRWNHPIMGFLSPAQFVPIFEKTGFITKVDEFVWEKVCAILRELEDKGYPQIPISVNVSRADIYNVDLQTTLTGLTESYGIPRDRLYLEITESAYTVDQKQIVGVVDDLRKLGFIIEMDDFGSGYSSLNMLNEMPVDVLKLDLKFLQSDQKKILGRGILHFIVGLARWMGLSIVAEGVETEEQVQRLLDLGCDYAQGYYYARPMPVDRFMALLEETEVVGPDEAPEGVGRDREKPASLIVVADEDQEYRAMAARALAGGYTVMEAGDYDMTMGILAEKEWEIAALVLSYELSETAIGSTLEALSKGRDAWRVPVVITGPDERETELKVLLRGADDYIGKPHSPELLLQRVKRVVFAAKNERTVKDLQEPFS